MKDFAQPCVFKAFARWFPEHVVANAASLVLRAEKLEPLLLVAGSDATFCAVLKMKQRRAQEKELQRCKVMELVYFAMTRSLEFSLFGKLARIVAASKDKGVKVRFSQGDEALMKLYWVGCAFEVKFRDEGLDFCEKNEQVWRAVENFVPGVGTCVLNYL